MPAAEQLFDRLRRRIRRLILWEGTACAGLVLATERDRLVPGRALDRIALHEILAAVRDERQYALWLLARARTEPDADAVADAVEAAMREQTQFKTLRDLLTPAP